MEWISVKDRPLIIQTKSGWISTEEGSEEFMAAVPYNDSTKPNEELWWIHHCVIEDVIGLCVVGDEENIPCGWEINDITHYAIIEPPKQ